MKSAEIKLDLIGKIEQSNVQQLREMYGLIVNYLNHGEDPEEWEHLSVAQREKIELGIKQANNNELHPLDQTVEDLKRKYRINE